MDYTEIFGAVTGLLYVILEIKQRKIMWIVGGISALVYSLIFFESSLYAAMGLQLYFLGASVYGWIAWSRQSDISAGDKPVIVPLSLKRAFFSILITLLVFALIWYILKNYSNDPMPVTDSIIAALSMLATYWVSRKHIQHWLIWIVADILAVYMYSSQGLYATTALYFIYIIAASAGFFHWRKFPLVLN
ncbi:MAG: nicotinamide riboside transporter PnuC [Bacteroidales bacterium]